jgi:hypothetical protein
VKRALLLVVCCLALAPACAEKSNAPAASVNGVTVTTKDVVDELDAIRANPDYLENIDGQFKQQGSAVVGSAAGSYDAGFVGQVLMRQLQFALAHDEVERRQLEVTDDCKEAAKNDLIQSLGGGDEQKGQEQLAGFSADYRNKIEGWYTDQFVLQSDLVHQPCGGEAAGKAYFDAHPEEFVQLCVSVISLADENTANAVAEQARAGGDFASLAQQFSTDTKSGSMGGDAGCLYPSEISSVFAPTLQATATGAVTDPVTNNNGFLVFKVTDRKPAAYSDVSSQAEQLALRDQSVEFGSWLRHAFEDGQVTVDPRYGTFDPSTYKITPPAVDSESSSSGSEAPPTSSP